jgi:hypothetical protein
MDDKNSFEMKIEKVAETQETALIKSLLIKTFGTNDLNKLKQLNAIINFNGITYNEILSGDYYLATMNNAPCIMTKYTTLGKKLRDLIGEYQTEFVCNEVWGEKHIDCIITQEGKK